MRLVNRADSPAVAFETTILVHGLPDPAARTLLEDAKRTAESHGVQLAVVGVLAGVPTVGMTDEEIERLFAAASVEKVNTANLGLAIQGGRDAATTVSTTVELAAAAGVPIFATGGIGGVHRGYGQRLDISADLLAIARHPVAVVTSGCKNLLDVAATREALESLGVPVIGYRTDRFPAFYQRRTDPPIPIDGSFESVESLAGFVQAELERTGRGLVVVNPIPEDAEIPAEDWDGWLAAADSDLAGSERASRHAGRDLTPRLLSAVHRLSNGRTLAANVALARSNTELACGLAAAIGDRRG